MSYLYLQIVIVPTVPARLTSATEFLGFLIWINVSVRMKRKIRGRCTGVATQPRSQGKKVQEADAGEAGPEGKTVYNRSDSD